MYVPLLTNALVSSQKFQIIEKDVNTFECFFCCVATSLKPLSSFWLMNCQKNEVLLSRADRLKKPAQKSSLKFTQLLKPEPKLLTSFMVHNQLLIQGQKNQILGNGFKFEISEFELAGPKCKTELIREGNLSKVQNISLTVINLTGKASPFSAVLLHW